MPGERFPASALQELKYVIRRDGLCAHRFTTLKDESKNLKGPVEGSAVTPLLDRAYRGIGSSLRHIWSRQGDRGSAESPSRSASMQAAVRKNEINGLDPSKRRFTWMQSDVYLDAKRRVLGHTAASAWMQTSRLMPGFPAADWAAEHCCRKSAHFLPVNVNRARSLLYTPPLPTFREKWEMTNGCR